MFFGGRTPVRSSRFSVSSSKKLIDCSENTLKRELRAKNMANLALFGSAAMSILKDKYWVQIGICAVNQARSGSSHDHSFCMQCRDQNVCAAAVLAGGGGVDVRNNAASRNAMGIPWQVSATISLTFRVGADGGGRGEGTRSAD